MFSTTSCVCNLGSLKIYLFQKRLLLKVPIAILTTLPLYLGDGHEPLDLSRLTACFPRAIST